MRLVCPKASNSNTRGCLIDCVCHIDSRSIVSVDERQTDKIGSYNLFSVIR